MSTVADKVVSAATAADRKSVPPWLSLPLFWTLAVGTLLYWGAHAHLERYITPQRGVGYWLGIVGGSLMLVLLLYSARKRFAWLRWMGSIPAWFNIHMVLGVAGPILILFHANFRLGATNSNVALFSMLLVAGSGVIGRYIYTRLHARLDGHQDDFQALKAAGDRLRSQDGALAVIPEVMTTLEALEGAWIAPRRATVAQLLRLPTGALRLAWARHRLHKIIHRGLAAGARQSEVLARHRHRMERVARDYVDRRLDAARRIAEFRVYSQLFSLWHVLHIPLFFMLLIAGLVHVVAINVY